MPSASGGMVPDPRPGGDAVPPAFGAVRAAEPAPAAAAGTADDEDDDEVRPRHPYTWLHFLALILVAFVLGFLIVLLWSRHGGLGSSGAASSPAVVSAVHSSSGVVADPV